MIELAGFDVVAELSIDTLSDFVNAEPVTLPDGSQVYLLDGKFTLSLPLSLPDVSDFTLSAFCEVSLGGVARTSSCGLVFELTDGTLEFAVGTIRHVTATMIISAPIIFVADPDHEGAGQSGSAGHQKCRRHRNCHDRCRDTWHD